MPIEVLGLDHVYLAVADFRMSEAFYDRVMRALGFKKGDMSIGGDPHAHYFNRITQISIRPARTDRCHDPYAPGLHHLCLRLADSAAVEAAVDELRALGVEVSEPALYTDYAADYYAAFFQDPDGIRLELVASRRLRAEIVEQWDRLDGFLNPLQRLREQGGRAETSP